MHAAADEDRVVGKHFYWLLSYMEPTAPEREPVKAAQGLFLRWADSGSKPPREDWDAAQDALNAAGERAGSSEDKSLYLTGELALCVMKQEPGRPFDQVTGRMPPPSGFALGGG